MRPTPKEPDQCIVSFESNVGGALLGPALRTGEVVHFRPEEIHRFETVTLSLYCNGFKTQGPRSFVVTWSPFSLVQACRFHSVEADQALPWLRLFKVSVFQHGHTHFFASRGKDADTERARWVADIARAIRLLTQSLFPRYRLRSEPVAWCSWTGKRLLAGYLLLCDDQGVSLVFCELHAPWDGCALFVGYDDDSCEAQVMQATLVASTCVSERVGVDCSCFGFGNYHFTTRTSAEKILWLRAISNVKVKLRHQAPNPSAEDLQHFRLSILEHARGIQPPEDEFTRVELLPRRTRLVQKTYPGRQDPVASAPRGSAAPCAGDSDGLTLHTLRRPRRLSLSAEMDDRMPPPVPDAAARGCSDMAGGTAPHTVDAHGPRLEPEEQLNPEVPDAAARGFSDMAGGTAPHTVDAHGPRLEPEEQLNPEDKLTPLPVPDALAREYCETADGMAPHTDAREPCLIPEKHQYPEVDGTLPPVPDEPARGRCGTTGGTAPRTVDAHAPRLKPEEYLNPEVLSKQITPSPDLPRTGFALLRPPVESFGPHGLPVPEDRVAHGPPTSETAAPDAAAGPTTTGAPCSKQ